MNTQPRQQQTRALTGHRLGAWHGKAKHSTETVKAALAPRAQGLSYPKIGAQIGVSEWTVADWCQGKTRWVDGF